MMTTKAVELHPGLPEIPLRCRKLPVFRGYPVPFFVEWVDGEPEFRAMNGEKWVRCVREQICWVCGESLGSYLAFVIGPMCALNRISSEPPSHRECAEWSARACPFLSMPKAKRREAGLPEEITKGEANLPRNPGVAMVWITREFDVIKAGSASSSGYLIEVGDPTEVLFFAEGRKATREEIMHSIDTGLPSLEAAALNEGSDAPEALAQIRRKYAEAKELVERVA